MGRSLAHRRRWRGLCGSVHRRTAQAEHRASCCHCTIGSARSSTRSISCFRRSRAVPAPEPRALFLQGYERVGNVQLSLELRVALRELDVASFRLGELRLATGLLCGEARRAALGHCLQGSPDRAARTGLTLTLWSSCGIRNTEWLGHDLRSILRPSVLRFPGGAVSNDVGTGGCDLGCPPQLCGFGSLEAGFATLGAAQIQRRDPPRTSDRLVASTEVETMAELNPSR